LAGIVGTSSMANAATLSPQRDGVRAIAHASESDPSVPPTAPSFVAQPKSTAVRVGQQAQFSVTVAGFPTPSLQWYVHGSGFGPFAPIPGATGATYKFTPALSDSNNDYYVIATNPYGGVQSYMVSVFVTP
jgi:hypothetical protein